ncbi:DUF4136 domain-containing protein [Bacteroidales bacterium OttesenSCG-928-B11]|nr:DUF4136 domain-containing protein [Bacteroidales bacterium OttesenSCG-928-B11]MDL2326942.1 DUF4136 domain-containing protein [Bacteroidales bacterium OttesenSCG-928-A14]
MRKKNLSNGIVLLSLALITLFTGCYPHDETSVTDWDLSISIKNPDFNDYGAIQSYYLFPYVEHGDKENPSKKFDDEIIDAVQRNLSELGWSSSTNPENADVVITCSALNTDVYSYWQSYWYPAWNDYYYDYIPYYPWGVMSGISYDYTEGTVAIQMNYVGDEVNVEPGVVTQAPVIWLGLIDGLLNDTQTSISTRIKTGIDQCFNDAPYLKGE